MNSRHKVKRSIRSSTYKFNAVCVIQSEKKCRDSRRNSSWPLHHDNAPAHSLLLICEFLAKTSTVIIPLPPYSPNMAPCDFFWVPKIKRTLKGRRLSSIDKIKKRLAERAASYPKDRVPEVFRGWHKCTRSVMETSLKEITLM